MRRKSPIFRVVIILLILFLLLSGTAYAAAIETVIAKNSGGEHYVYDYALIIDSYTQKILGKQAPLYDDFARNSVIAVSSAENGYVDYQDVLSAYTSSVVKGKSFDLLQYIESENAKPFTLAAGMKKVSVEDGKLVFSDWLLPQAEALLKKFNEIATDIEMQEAITTHAAELKLELTSYHKLTAYSQNQVVWALINQRPQAGYANADMVKQIFAAAVHDALTIQNNALKAVNDAPIAPLMQTALVQNASVLELDLTALNQRQPQERTKIMGILVSQRPYGTVEELQSALADALQEDYSILEAINKITDNEQMRTALTAHADGLQLDLSWYYKLNTYGQSQTADAVLKNRPPSGYLNITDIKPVFNNAVNHALTAQNNVMNSINTAVDAQSMQTLLSTGAVILELDITRFNNLLPESKITALDILMKGRPYHTPAAIKTAFNNVLGSLDMTRIIQYVDYGHSFNEAITLQMGHSPQTDLLGNGWQTADRNLVEWYLNTANFLDEMKPAALIKSGPARMRSGPGLTYDTFLVLDEGTGPFFIINQAEDSAGYTWYRLLTDNRAGWVRQDLLTITKAKAEGIFQFLLLSGTSEVNAAEVNTNILQGKGILEDQAEAFILGARQYNINEIFLISLALHESRNGTSELANGIEYNGQIVYNMYGIRAVDSDPINKGAEYAYKQGWFTPELAIIGGAEFVANSYINHPSYRQNTLYKMRWNPANPGVHQYATDIGWAAKQVKKIKELYEQVTSYVLRFEIPRYRQ